MIDVLSRVPPGDLEDVLIVVAVVLAVGLLGLAGLIILAVQRYREREIAASVVADMLDRGIAPQEIIAVLKAMRLEASPGQRWRGRLNELLGKRERATSG